MGGYGGTQQLSLVDPRASQALNDLIQSEREYVKNLSLVLAVCWSRTHHRGLVSVTVSDSYFLISKCYYSPMKAWASKNKKILAEEEVDQMFGGIDIISKFHAQFLQRLEGTKAPGGEQLGVVLKTMAPMMRVYTNINTLDVTMELLKKAKKAGKPFTSLLEDCKQKSGSPNDLDFFLQLPPKRLPQYEQLIMVRIECVLGCWQYS
jgi:hypothetical protein